ncbi:chromosome partitioning protein [Thioclava dalianensis]|uniref:Chromosome partitioning protein n=1 Tax=Thioclava dalianensis TaxID=1185766 RepID=A0A074U5L3_9RHOB|nr:CpsD/CapB family tyrosine-protein kinase [Thioclava dalianensis]KEP69927.1 chromosome partitioning protein [Thioclava dalianensis]SFN17521.1 capsular exopolysaccharide family [Thioclava dalianensis]
MVERLRNAIAQARASREGRSLPGTRGPSVDAISPRSGFSGAAWQALTPWVPAQRQLEAVRVVTTDLRADAAPFDLMRTKILQQMRANGWRRLAVTSPSASCGKSTVALNLAFSLGRQEELFTILIGSDMRRPSLYKMLQFEDQMQVSEVLAGRAELSDHARRYGNNLAIATNCRHVANPSELIQSHTTPQALDRIEALYQPDLIVFDTAPVLVSDDTLALASHVDCMLIIVAAEETPIKEIDLCERELAERTNVMGVVVNKARFSSTEYGYGYGYGPAAGGAERG